MGQLPLREAYSAAFAKNIPGTRTKARCVNGGPLFIASTLPQRSLPPVSKNRSGWILGRGRGGHTRLGAEVEGPPSSQPRRALPHRFRIKYVSNCVINNIALRQSCGRLLLTGAGSIFHLDRFHPDFSTVRPQWSPAAAFYVGLDKPGSITTTCTKSFAEFTKHAGNDRGLTSRHCERGFQNDYA